KVAIADGDYLHLTIRSEARELVRLELLGLGEMNIHNLYNGSIVSAVYVWNVRSVPRSSRDVPDSGWNLLFADRSKRDDVKKSAARIALKRPQSFLVQVECSYGG